VATPVDDHACFSVVSAIKNDISGEQMAGCIIKMDSMTFNSDIGIDVL
jgi:hypothetical protein